VVERQAIERALQGLWAKLARLAATGQVEDIILLLAHPTNPHPH
jgi:hypothetical protein